RDHRADLHQAVVENAGDRCTHDRTLEARSQHAGIRLGRLRTVLRTEVGDLRPDLLFLPQPALALVRLLRQLGLGARLVILRTQYLVIDARDRLARAHIRPLVHQELTDDTALLGRDLYVGRCLERAGQQIGRAHV